MSLKLVNGLDLTEELGILKWEAPENTNLAGNARGNFPCFIPKTDEERCLSGDTLVDTEFGLLTISEIVEKRMEVRVKSYNVGTGDVELKPIVGHSIVEKTDELWFRLTTNKGKVLVVTGEHRIWGDDIKTYRRIQDLKVGQLVTTI